MSKHRVKGWILCFLGAACVAALMAFAPAQKADESAASEPVSFSRPSGFYDDAFYLELDAGGNDIYYTLDSSDPDENSTRYTGPILIQDASPNENVYSMIEDVTVYFDADLLKNNNRTLTHEYRIPQQPVDKATVVRAVSVDASGKRSKPYEAVYFVGYGEKPGYEGTYTMTITTAPENLFDFEKGIYVLGKKFADIVKDGTVQSNTRFVFNWDANYRQKGMDWEREAAIHCFDPEGKEVFAGNYGIRIQGKATRSYLAKNLNIFARRKYGSPVIDVGEMFGKNYTLKKLNLYYGSDYLMLKDYLVCGLAEDLDMATRPFIPCALFLDGEYWGLYWLTPRFKTDYLSQEYGVDAQNIIVIKQGRVEEGQAEDIKLYREMLSFVADNDMSDPELYQRACEMIDMQSFIDYYALEIYIENIDWNPNNLALWRTKYKASDPCSDGRWRWILYDVDHGMNMNYVERDLLKEMMNRDAMLPSLMKNEEFASAMYAKLVELATDTFEPGRVKDFVESYKTNMAGPMAKKIERFKGDLQTIDVFYGKCDDIVQFFQERHDYIINTYGERG